MCIRDSCADPVRVLPRAQAAAARLAGEAPCTRTPPQPSEPNRSHNRALPSLLPLISRWIPRATRRACAMLAAVVAVVCDLPAARRVEGFLLLHLRDRLHDHARPRRRLGPPIPSRAPRRALAH
eukprot:6014523-Prymnesium_polylepis.1